jgi:unsaturated rhamnogalacturonyl hydrolase
MIINLLILLLSILFFFLFLPDFFVTFKIWFSRIKIGKWSNKEVWRKAVTTCSLSWLKNTPTIKLTDNHRLIIIDILRGNYKRDAIQYWQEASLVLGLSAHYHQTKEDKIKTEIQRLLDRKINSDGNWVNPILESDGVILGYAFIQLSWIDHQKLKPAYDALWNLILDLKGDDSTVAYKKQSRKIRFVDTIGFICPFLVEYGQRYNVPEAVDLAIQQIEEFNQFAMLGDTFIPCHTYAMQSKLPVGLFGWGRGLGWYAIGLIDAWQALDASHPKKPELTQWVKQFARMAIRFQRDNGSWGWIIMQDNARSDSSTTATLAWFLTNASSIASIENECKQASAKALQYLMKVTRRDGAIDFSQGDTKGIGIHSQEFDILPFTQGFALRTAAH